MNKNFYDVLGIGNAIVDILVEVSDEFLVSMNLKKGSMSLVNEEVSKKIFKQISPKMKCSGGSAANTLAGIASLGSSSAFIGKVCDDPLGREFFEDITSLGVDFGTQMITTGPATATCIIFVTEDAQRTMVTHLGACIELAPNDIDEDKVVNAQVTYLEGYLWDPPEAKKAFLKAAELAHQSERKVSLSLSDSFCVDRHRLEFIDFIKSHVDILFGNEEEIISLYQTRSLNEAISEVSKDSSITAITCGAEGSIIVFQDQISKIDATHVSCVVDTTGAGDAFAAGFLYGYTNSYDFLASAHIGSKCSAEVISDFGGRSKTSLLSCLAPNP